MSHTAVAGLLLAIVTLWSGDVHVVYAQWTPPMPPAIAHKPSPPPLVQLPAYVPTTPVTGTIVDGAGRPIAGVRVAIRDAAGSMIGVESDGNGDFQIAAPIADKHTLLLDGPTVFPAEVPWHAGEPPPRILLARRAHLEARVTAADQPVAGAEVAITDGSKPTLATAITDQNGVAKFDDLMPGPYEIWARRDTQVSALVRVADVGTETSDVALALAPGSSIRGQLAAGDGGTEKLPAGSTVTLAPLDVDHAVRVATVDDAGKFVVDGIPRGRWKLEGEAHGFVQSGEVIVDAKADRADAIVRMLRAGAVAGLVVDAAGAPVANATIVLRQQGVQAGLVEERPVVASAARLRWVHPLAGKRYLPLGDHLRFGAFRAGMRPAECGAGHCGIDIGWQRGTVVHAAADGEIALAFTELRGEAGRYVAIDHGDGLRTFYMHLDELRAGLEIGQKIRAGDPLGTVGQTGAARGPHLHFAITQERDGRSWYIDPEPILQHAVVLPAARALDPIDARAATVIASLRAGELGGTRPPPATQQAFTTDARGRFRIDNVAPGSYVAVAFAAELAPGTSPTFAVRTGSETPDITITLRPGMLVQGRVLGRDGPIAGATITAGAGVGESAQKVATTYTSNTGEYALRALTGTITLSVTAPGYGVIERTVSLAETAPGRTRQREDFTLVIENAQLRGQVLAPDGGPAGAVSLRIVDGPTRRSALTDATGRFTLDRVAVGRYTVELAAADYPPTRVTLTADQFSELRLERGGSVRAELRDPYTGQPLANVRVEAAGPNGRTTTAITDARGIAELRALAVGEWTIRARGKGYVEARQTVGVRASTVPIDVRLELARGVTLAGVVRDRYGRRVAGARVFVDGASTQTDSDGNFKLVDAPPGRYALEAELDGARGAVAVQVQPGDERLSLTIDLAQ
ncbi:MAG TPA: carboxypeptidase regulatory-like domain-containing protein [Kofleriaceae bacterium]|nr:carboxypeptidase regulatory-like domain-containing protein [Kofleriaceae bacterium]